MKTADSMLPRKEVLVLVLLAGALAWLAVGQARLGKSRRALADSREQYAELKQRLATAAAARDTARRELQEQRKASQQAQAALAKAEQELARLDPEARWALPPANGPEWDVQSPYVWVNKDLLGQLPASPFTERAELRGEVAAVLGLAPAEAGALNQKLARLMREYKGLEAAHAERINEPLPGIASDGPQVTVRVTPFPDDGARLQQQFQDAVRAALGPQRAGLVLEAAAGWLESQFALSDAEPKTISVVRHPNGTYNLSRRSGGSWFSTGGFTRLGDYIPDHLLPLFSETLDPQPGAGR